MTRTYKSDFLLLLTAIIWGFAFVAQRMGMEHTGPFMFNAVRFALGSISLLPLIYLFGDKKPVEALQKRSSLLINGGILTGLALFIAASLQQIGVVYTTAGNAGFITGLYVVIVPILGLFFGKKTSLGVWSGAILAMVGMYLLSVNETFSIQLGDFLVFISAFFWAAHMLLISRYAPLVHTIKLAAIQFAICSILSFITAFFVEHNTIQGIIDATIPILYGGIMSVGVAYTIQIIAQKKAHPSVAAVILSTESVFALLGGWLVLNESLSFRSAIGCGLMFAGILIAQLLPNFPLKRKKLLE